MWEIWSSCSVTCGSGIQTSKRIEAQHPMNGGQPCTGASTRQRSCDEDECQTTTTIATTTMTTTTATTITVTTTMTPTTTLTTNTLTTSTVTQQPSQMVDCTWGDWSAWNTCHKTCNYWGTKGRNRTITQAALNGGTECTGDETESHVCDSNTCPGRYF